VHWNCLIYTHSFVTTWQNECTQKFKGTFRRPYAWPLIFPLSSKLALKYVQNSRPDFGGVLNHYHWIFSVENIKYFKNSYTVKRNHRQIISLIVITINYSIIAQDIQFVRGQHWIGESRRKFEIHARRGSCRQLRPRAPAAPKTADMLIFHQKMMTMMTSYWWPHFFGCWSVINNKIISANFLRCKPQKCWHCFAV